jgi:RNA polymerase sigma-70 factor (ECF subfamily)
MPLTEPLEVPEDEDRVAVRRCLAGSVDAFEPVVRRNAQRLIRLAYHLLGDWDEARDLAQETFAKAYLCLGSYDGDRPFSTWICTIAARLAADRLRRRRVRSRAQDRMAPRPAPGLDVETTLSLREALDQLTPRQRQAVALCDLHGFSASEASMMIGCSASTIRVLRFLARRRLRELLGRTVGVAEADLAAGGEETS